MLNLLFGRKSRLVYTLEVAGIIAVVISFFKVSKVAAVFLFFHLMIRFCAHWKWYKKFNKDNNFGIGTHFTKMVVASSYILFIFGCAALLAKSIILIYLGSAGILFILHINAILLYFHFRDKDNTPPNFLSRL
jgi:hypothetical protein